MHRRFGFDIDFQPDVWAKTISSTSVKLINRIVTAVCYLMLYVTFGAIFFILCANVFLRYFFGTSLAWASEIPEQLFPWLIMAGVVLAAQHGAHIATTFVADMVTGRARTALNTLVHLVIIGLYATLSVVVLTLIPVVADERSPILQIPGWVTYVCLFIGFVLIALIHLAAMLDFRPVVEEPAGVYE